MKIRTQDDFLEFLDRELTWRKREFSQYSFQLQALNTKDMPLMLKTGVALIYAHWEGYIKISSRKYFEYLRVVGGDVSGYTENVIAVCLYKTHVTKNEKMPFAEFYDAVRKARSPNFKFHGAIEDAISTKSNLKYDVFAEILTMLNIQSAPYELKKQFIDHKLCYLRNAFCHGEKIDVDKTNFDILLSTVSELLENFKTDLSNIVVSQTYFGESSA